MWVKCFQERHPYSLFLHASAERSSPTSSQWRPDPGVSGSCTTKTPDKINEGKPVGDLSLMTFALCVLSVLFSQASLHFGWLFPVLWVTVQTVHSGWMLRHRNSNKKRRTTQDLGGDCGKNFWLPSFQVKVLKNNTTRKYRKRAKEWGLF